MLVEFRVKNFRSFKGEQCFSFVASDDKNQASHCIKTNNKNVERVLGSAAIYGANASGKSNLTFALSCMKELILSSTRIQEKQFVDLYTPFRLDDSSSHRPTEFSIVVIIDELIYQYSFSYDSKMIYKESLDINHDKCFVRDDEEWSFSDQFAQDNDLYKTWQKATRANALFLTTAIQLNCDQLKPFYDWFAQKITVIHAHFDPRDIKENPFKSRIDDQEYKDKALTFLRSADLHLEDIKKNEKDELEFAHKSANGSIVWFDVRFESLGTQKLVAHSGYYLDALSDGGLIIVDEIENSLHPLVIDNIIKHFHDRVINKKNAQLWMVTHNTSLLSSKIFRRDQVWFVEKNDKQETQLYPLSDFHPSDGEVFDRDYLMGRYGALPFVEKKGF